MYKINKEKGEWTMEKILKIRSYDPQPEKPDIDDLIYGDEHHVSEK